MVKKRCTNEACNKLLNSYNHGPLCYDCIPWGKVEEDYFRVEKLQETRAGRKRLFLEAARYKTPEELADEFEIDVESVERRLKRSGAKWVDVRDKIKIPSYADIQYYLAGEEREQFLGRSKRSHVTSFEKLRFLSLYEDYFDAASPAGHRYQKWAKTKKEKKT